jgi:hypothetical protein
MMKLFEKKANKTTVFFLHIPKCAGSTLSFEIIKNQYKSGKYVFFYDQGYPVMVDRLKGMSRAEQRKIECIAGHFFFGIQEYYIARPVTFITILRDPIERVISHYYFVLRSNTHYLHKAVTQNNLTLKEYVVNKLSTELNNGQARILAGLEWNVPYGECPQALLDKAKENLETHFIAVGLTEKFDEFLRLLNHKLGWDTHVQKKQNVGKNRLKRADIDNETLAIIEKYNQLDIQLYQYAQDLFNRQFAGLSR